MPQNNSKARRDWRKKGADARTECWEKYDPQRLIIRKYSHGPGAPGLTKVREAQAISRP